MAIGVLLVFLGQSLGLSPAYAQDYYLPAPGVMVHLSPDFNPPILKGIKVHPDNPFRFDFILDKGDSQLSNYQLKDESSKLIKYFLASLTISEKDLWVNLSPYEKDRIVPESFGQTEMGRDLLAEDYMLKQITASLIYPEGEVGKKFWKRIYEETAKKFGTTNIPVNTFNKVWIVPEKAVVYENAKAGTAYVVESKLKVMLEQDYLSMSKNSPPLVGGAREGEISANTPRPNPPHEGEGINALGSQIVREIVIPELTKEVNEGKNFAQLRQAYNSLILATWYKKKIKDSILAQVYENKNKVAGVNIDDPQEKQKIYERYLKAFKKGVYNYIKEENDPITQQTIPRKYFSGGIKWDMAMTTYTDHVLDALPSDLYSASVDVKPFDMAMATKKPAEVKSVLKSLLEPLMGKDTRIDKIIRESLIPNFRKVKMFEANLTLITTIGKRIPAESETIDSVISFLIFNQITNLLQRKLYPDAVEVLLRFTELTDKEIEDAMTKLLGLNAPPDVVKTIGTLLERYKGQRHSQRTQISDAEFKLQATRKIEEILKPLLDRDEYAEVLEFISDEDFLREMLIKDIPEKIIAIVIKETTIKTDIYREALLKQIKEQISAGKIISNFNPKLSVKTVHQLLILEKIAAYGRLLGLLPVHVSIIGIFVNLKKMGINITLKRLSAKYTFSEIDEQFRHMSAEIANRHQMSHVIHDVITPLLHGVIDMHYEDTQVATEQESILLDAIMNEVELRRYVKRPEIDSPAAMVNQIVFETHADHVTVRQRINSVISPKGLDGWFYALREEITGHSISINNLKPVVIDGRAVYYLDDNLNKKRKRISNSELIAIKATLIIFMNNYKNNQLYDAIAPGLHKIRLNLQDARLFVRMFPNQIVIVGYRSPDEIKRSGRGRSGLTNESEMHFSQFSAKFYKIFGDFKRNFKPEELKMDLAMSANYFHAVPSNVARNGGIDFTSDKALSVQNNGQGIKFHIDPAQLAQLQNAPGFVPVIINIQPMTNLRDFLGLKEQENNVSMAA
jgi:hypothetical protein